MRASALLLAVPLLSGTRPLDVARVPVAIASVAPIVSAAPPRVPTPVDRVIARAREEVASGVVYDPSWYPMGYPNGDVDPAIGVCTDVVIRGYRAAGVDFQKLVHEDVLRSPGSYEPWVKKPDATIDHRRVGPLLTYLRRHARSLPVDRDWAAGDVVVISFNPCPACNPAHVGVVSDKLGPRGVPLLIHNMGPTPREDDVLDAWTHLGHFRLL